ncbi:hypothetical protein [Sporomusa sphaeroides]|uniref:Uncharacterized protein n=1 Tax=Sporomusa sphaeroides DSM 2875 TaxID=1337886 RepID=A0A1U7MA31_9FIRM|nr:hypothetical protein [Sporomusa sphaeroides]OLS54327.1 hypothetical protein SPSPH_45730 [Sporomusa sphaeroides DSM 2875]CVK21556.1 hypothetical protein SSPH_04248 [Sporomusa sphaeroides DSM 2875]
MSKLRESLNKSLEGLPQNTNAAVKAIVNRGAADDNSQPKNLQTEKNPVPKLSKPLKFSDTHKNASLLLRNDVIKNIDDLAEGAGKGFKTKLVNEALIRILKEYGIELPDYGG